MTSIQGTPNQASEGLKGYPTIDQTFSGTDFRVLYVSRKSGGLVKTLRSLQTLSFSTHTEVYPVRAIGTRSPKAHVRGNRTVAGTMIFMFDGNDPFLGELVNDYENLQKNEPYDTRLCHVELIEPFDLAVAAVSEVPLASLDIDGMSVFASRMYLADIVLAESGGTISVHDTYTEIMYTYTASYVVPFASTIDPSLIRRLYIPQDIQRTDTATLYESYKNYLASIKDRNV